MKFFPSFNLISSDFGVDLNPGIGLELLTLEDVALLMFCLIKLFE